MIIPMVCFTCGRPIAHLWFTYLERIKQLDKEARENKSNTNVHEIMKVDEVGIEFEVLKELQIAPLCCRRMFLSQHDMWDKVK